MSSARCRDLLATFAFFGSLPASARATLASEMQTVRLAAGSVFYRQAGRCPQVAFVAAGDLRVFKLNEAGREITLYHVGSRDVCLVNVLCAFLDLDSPATAVAETEVEAAVLPATRFRAWVREQKSLHDYLFGRIFERVVDLMTLVEEVAFHRVDQRLADCLLRLASGGSSGRSTVHCTHESLAQEVGSAREVVSRILKSLELRGVIHLRRGQVEILDPAGLADLRQSGTALQFP